MAAFRNIRETFDNMPDNGKLVHALDARFFAPLRRPRTRRVGVELELPIWNQTPGAATDFDADRKSVV